MTGAAATEAIRTFLENRSEFYRTLLARVPEPKFRDYLQGAVGPHLEDPELPLKPLEISLEQHSLLHGLLLRDLLKKSGAGHTLARTTISFEEALKRAQHVEETGLLFFGALAEAATEPAYAVRQSDKHRQCLSKLLKLDDAVRYRKIEMPSSP